MRSGQMLVELLLALAVTVLVLVALVQITTRSIFSTRFSQEQSQATTLGTQAVEWLRLQRSLDWTAFFANSGKYCLQNLLWQPPPPCLPITGTIYTRTVTMTPLALAGGGAMVTAVVEVVWSEGSKNFTANQTAVFYKY